MDLLSIIIGRYVIELIGALIRFSINYLIAKIKGTKHIKFEEYWHKKKGGVYEKSETETANRIAGGFFLFSIIIFIVISI